jgi:hypothetical protein
MLDALQRSAFAQVIAQSQMITASLSALHVLGFSMVMSGAFIFGLRSLGLLFVERPAMELLRPAARVLFIGVAMNILTGALLFSPRAASAVANIFFRTKMVLLVTAVLLQVVVLRAAIVRARTLDDTGPGALAGTAGLTLWIGVALAACAFILLE